MPTYQYACTECGHAYEQFQSFSDDTLTECPECQGKLRKVFNAVGVVFKGSGFYRNDSRQKATSSEPAAGNSDTKSDTKSDTRSDTKSDTRSDTKSDTRSDSGSGTTSGGSSEKKSDAGSSSSTSPATKSA